MPARFREGTLESAAGAGLIKSARIVSEIAIRRVLCITPHAIAGFTLVSDRPGFQTR